MRVKLLSDLHLEGNSYNYQNHGEDVLVLAGDIHNRNRHDSIIRQIPATVRVILVAGNHEYYRGEFNHVNEFLTGLQVKYPNFTFLNNSSVTIDGVEFFGGTMFTDFGLYGESNKPLAAIDASRGIADFYHIKKIGSDGTERIWNTLDHLSEHTKFVRELDHWLTTTEGKKRVVVSHFVPSAQAIDPQFANSNLNPYFTAEMDRFMGLVDYWFAGHTHTSFDRDIHGTRLVINPKGYGKENTHGFKPDLVIEI